MPVTVLVAMLRVEVIFLFIDLGHKYLVMVNKKRGGLQKTASFNVRFMECYSPCWAYSSIILMMVSVALTMLGIGTNSYRL